MSGYALMWSGGKDSALALWRARRLGLRVDWLVNIHDRATGRVRFHATPIDAIAIQADAAGVPLVSVPTDWETFDQSLGHALATLVQQGCGGVVFGDIHLTDVRAWYEERTRGAGLEHVEPLWGEDPASLLEEFVSIGGRAVLTCVETAKLDVSWLGRVIDSDFVRDVRRTGIDPCGENGEYHSFAFAGPFFARPLAWRAGERRDDRRFAQLDVTVERSDGRWTSTNIRKTTAVSAMVKFSRSR
ncbi:MAG TPA: diphthine--ammonia ligase [Candidatus Limnocylindria bacterium]|nr:diphthine--ammonia ligase [Candidatus Limnocylindria bacterium]